MFKFVATALPDLPVAEDRILKTTGNEAELHIIPLPFESLQDKTKENWFNTLIEADAILVRSGIIDKYLIDQLKNCKVISLHGVGVDQVDVKYCYEKGIKVTNVPAGNATAVAELTIALMLDSLRKISYANKQISSKNWDSAKSIGNELGNQKVGLIGFGNIGYKVAQLCRCFGCEIKYFDKSANNTEFEFCDLNSLLEWSNIISIHVPLNNNTRSLIGYKELIKLGNNGILINVARGAIVNEEDLKRILRENKLKWLCCDVFWEEPPNFNNEIFNYNNVTFTPHIGGSTYECLENIALRATKDMLRVCKEQEPVHLVKV
ncbi:hypothetical protein IMX26_02720 [Clostridium sp. 'deep sea']|uniref:2-hydroxyacid dehydrogenase n=1 Tax=Clostridium sp. 'deep sea' TaxID=2779445 RepID=UPI0018965989|nr:NAD(P)-dependent oxidoreductase [Clostridium sp. 'deep sea']QOR35754.1 hypothetical protein IMX26_02720 [Clostridium sp. 'deep sea']